MVTGPLATMVFQLENIPAGAGMGTCGLVGPIGIYTAMSGEGPRMWARDPHDLFHPSRRPHLDLRRALQEGRMDP